MQRTLNFLLLPLFSLSIFFNGCSSHQDVVSVSEAHLYNNNYGLNQNLEVDSIIQNEVVSMNEPYQSSSDLTTTPPKLEEGTFLAEDYVQKPPVITYKYQFDKKFYKEAIWKSESSF